MPRVQKMSEAIAPDFRIEENKVQVYFSAAGQYTARARIQQRLKAVLNNKAGTSDSLCHLSISTKTSTLLLTGFWQQSLQWGLAHS